MEIKKAKNESFFESDEMKILMLKKFFQKIKRSNQNFEFIYKKVFVYFYSLYR